MIEQNRHQPPIRDSIKKHRQGGVVKMINSEQKLKARPELVRQSNKQAWLCIHKKYQRKDQ